MSYFLFTLYVCWKILDLVSKYNKCPSPMTYDFRQWPHISMWCAMVKTDQVARLICVLLLLIIVQFLPDKQKYCKRPGKISADISARLIRVTCNKVSGILVHKNWIVDVKSWIQHILLFSKPVLDIKMRLVVTVELGTKCMPNSDSASNFMPEYKVLGY